MTVLGLLRTAAICVFTVLAGILLGAWLGGCGGSLPEPMDCPAPSVVFNSPELLSEATTASEPPGCECDAPLKPALTSAWPGGCSYTYEAKCANCAVDVTYRRRTP